MSGCSSSYWGEIGIPSSSMSSVVDMEAMSMKAKSVQIKVPNLHQPSSQQKQQVQALQSELCQPDHTSLHTIELLKHCRQVRTKILTYQHQDIMKTEDRFGNPRLVPLPDMPEKRQPEKSSESISVVTGIKNRLECPKFKLRDGSIEIDNNVARHLSRRAVATVCAHSGYESCQESSLEVLTDVLHEYLRNTCKLLRVAVDREATTGQTGFQDVLTQVFHEIGIGSKENLFKFWKAKIKDYHDHIEQQTRNARKKYEDMKNPNYVTHHNEDKSPRVKDEPLSVVSLDDSLSRQTPEEGGDNQSYDTSSSSDAPNTLTHSLHNLNAMELDESGGGSQERGRVGMGEEENSGGEWYNVSIKQEDCEDEDRTASSGIKREMLSEDTHQHVKVEGSIEDESPIISHVSHHMLNVDVSSVPEKKIQLMPPKKKKKK